MSFDRWLAARDGRTLAREWAKLGANKIEFGTSAVSIATEGVVLLAARYLGHPPESLAWLCEWSGRHDRQPTFRNERTVTRCFLDGTLDLEGERIETWEVREVNEGTRGLQHQQIYYSFDMRDDRGSSASVLRLFDRETRSAISIPVLSNTVWMIGEPIDLSPLLFKYRVSFSLPWNGYDLDSMRGFLARVATDLDAHFDTCATWPGGLVDDKRREGNLYNAPSRTRRFRFEIGDYAIDAQEEVIDYSTGQHRSLAGSVAGLPWGHQVGVTMRNAERGLEGWLDFTLPRTQVDAILARLATIPDISVDTPPGSAR